MNMVGISEEEHIHELTPGAHTENLVIIYTKKKQADHK